MRLTRMIIPFLAVALLSGCSTIDNAEVELIPPELGLRQLGGAGLAGSQVTGPISVNLRVTVYNPSNETITLKRVDFSTVGQGAYIVRASRPFTATIAPDKTVEVETWVPATAEESIVGNNGPVTMRVTAFFGSDLGQFRKVYVLNMNTDLSPLGKPVD